MAESIVLRPEDVSPAIVSGLEFERMVMKPTEAESRKNRIDPLLDKAGWSSERSNLSTEFLLSGLVTPKRDHRDIISQKGDEFIDYVLHGRNDKPLAIVEVKRDGRDPLAGKRQAADYADRVRLTYGIDPFIFLAAGEVVWFWDRGRYPPRQVAGFLTPDDLERLDFQRQYRESLESFGPDSSIAGRPYQIEAIKRVTEALQNGQRKILLVMATGTGKTRTVISVIDLLMRAKWVQRVLYLADRRELVRQALGEIKELLPNETRARIEGGEIDSSARIHVATYPSMMQAFERLSSGYYDLIIADESHRSIYNRYKVLFSHFDALQLGLTATPTDYIDHNTFELFECPDGLPTFYYPYETAVDEGYLVNYRVLEAQTSFQLQGIKAGQLPPETQRQVEEQGIELAEIDFEGGDLERRVTNTGTNDAMVREFMEACRKDGSGVLPAKTIIFAMSHNHATELWHSFNRLYPDLQRRGLAEIIDSHMERAESILEDFKRKDMPGVAISVDMLDTGIDVPAIQNLVFAKPVFSQVKFWQMIGRGTRQWRDPETGRRKEDFLIIDHWNNFAYFNINPEGEVAKPTEPLPVRLFRLRLEKLVLLRGRGDGAAAEATGSQLRDMLGKLPADSINVRPHHAELDTFASAQAWEDSAIDGTVIEHLSRAIAPLLRFLLDVNLPIMTFEVLTERLAVAYLAGQIQQVQALRKRIAQDLKLLPKSIEAVREQEEKLVWAQSDGFWHHLNYERIQDLQSTFAPLMRYRGHLRRDVVRLSLPDEITSRRWIIYGPGGEGAFADSYREQVELRVRELAQDHPTLQRLRRDEQIGEEDLEALAKDLNRPDLYVTEDALRQVYERPDAALSRQRPRSREEALKMMIEWITTYGVLGLNGVICPEEVLREAANNRERRESLKRFWHAVWEARRCLELYEVAKPTGSNEDRNLVDPEAEAILRKYGASGTTHRAKKEWAREVAAHTVGNYVSNETFTIFYRITKQISRGVHGYEAHETIAFDEGQGFRSLLGAMYVQMKNYMREGGEGRPCKRPGCYRLISFESAKVPDPKSGSTREHRTHSNKVFCSSACRQWWNDNFGNSKKAQVKRERRQAREQREEGHHE